MNFFYSFMQKGSKKSYRTKNFPDRKVFFSKFFIEIVGNWSPCFLSALVKYTVKRNRKNIFKKIKLSDFSIKPSDFSNNVVGNILPRRRCFGKMISLQQIASSQYSKNKKWEIWLILKISSSIEIRDKEKMLCLCNILPCCIVLDLLQGSS